MSADFVNGALEAVGALFICLSILKVLKDKCVAGVSWVHCSFFASWGLWNLYYYPHLGQWWSFAGGIAIMIANAVWIGLLLHYDECKK